MNTKRDNLLSYSRKELEEIVVRFGKKPFHGRQIHAWMHRRGVTTIDEMTDLSLDFRQALAAQYDIEIPELVEKISGDDKNSATKFLLKLVDGAEVEIVLIPSEERNTLCLSSQVGCAWGCKFCATGLLGLIRNMTAEEMIATYMIARQNSEQRISNIVFMGMGEPLANLDEVMKAWHILTDPDGIGLSQRKVTISTVGAPKKIRELGNEEYPPKLVFSIGSPSDEIRREILPVAGRFSLADNHAALLEYAEKTRNRITIALLVADGLNDSLEDARLLHRWIDNLPSKINLLRYNEAAGNFKRPDEAKVEAVAAELARLGRTVILRTSRGRDIAAACGQLAARAMKK